MTGKDLKQNKINEMLSQCLHKENSEAVLNTIKIILYTSVIVGAVWSLAYYVLVVNALPDLDFANLIPYLVSIAGIGLFFVVMFVTYFVSPGLIVQIAQIAQKDKNDKSLTSWLTGLVSLQIPKIKRYYNNNENNEQILKKIEISNAHLLYFFPSVVFVLMLLIYPDFKFLFLCSLVVALLFCFISKLPREHYFILICSVFLFVLIPSLTAIKIAALIETTEGKTMAIFILGVILIIAAIMNGQIAAKGFSFFKISSSIALNFIAGFGLIVITVVIFFSHIIGFTKKPNPFLISPFYMLKIGQVNAYISLDKEFIEKTQFREKGYLPEQCQTTFRFKVLSSIGKEYIVEYSPDNSLNKNLISESKIPRHTILRIPKDKIILIEYLDK